MNLFLSIKNGKLKLISAILMLILLFYIYNSLDFSSNYTFKAEERINWLLKSIKEEKFIFAFFHSQLYFIIKINNSNKDSIRKTTKMASF